MVCGKVWFSTYPTLIRGFAVFLVVSEGLAAEALGVASVGSGLLPPASVVEECNGDLPDVDHVA